jgi:hypothetical protein
MTELIPINAYPILFWFDREWMSDQKKRIEMQRELNTNMIYKN